MSIVSFFFSLVVFVFVFVFMLLPYPLELCRYFPRYFPVRPADHVSDWQPYTTGHDSRSTPVAQSAPRNLLTRWDVSSIPANGIFLTKN